MTQAISDIAQIFCAQGGEFITSTALFSEKLKKIKAFIFDWDGVFNDGTKNEQGTSNFSEVDSMGINLLRFGWWLHTPEMPYTAVISGERNVTSFQLVQREHYNSCYFRIKHKIAALEHFMNIYDLKPEQVAFFFDDALDLSIAEKCGLRIMVRHQGNPLFRQYVIENGLVDYITGQVGGAFAVREGCELLLGLRQIHDHTITKRLDFYPEYDQYLSERQLIESSFYTLAAGKFELQNIFF
ncbi:phosphatase [Runella slithyformis]|uniref:Low specificity phosphatase (HAD superfamily)-like protein n=1 Tax=Runella slithyformis (strain ATCC 29530 / DSM 19594 / LMG 11500 / NCIMB 11436 / LSU 4) TaxID=761193 RepID=A0A7U3ZJ43_RUNSL|nr:phosphatase [Runella slithyformis]AEI48132.1 low specificity phosphatase (HAD superfamily)-like protein [Runella slithyformis DSM 19594]